MNQSIDYNFQGTCEYKGVEYVLQMSVNAQEIIHRAKVNTSSNDPQILEYCSSFVAYAENKTLHDIDAGSFFKNKSKNLELDPLHYAWQRGLLDFLGDLALIKRKMKTETQAGSVVCNCSGLTEEELARYKNGLTFTMDTLVKETRAVLGADLAELIAKKL